MWSSSPRDNWARLVEAVVKREQIRQLCHQDSITTAASSSFRSDAPFHFSEEFPSVSSSRSERISVSPPRQRPVPTVSGIEVRKNATTITWKLFSALQRRMKLKDNHLDDIPGEAEVSKITLENRSLFDLQGLITSPINLVAPTPANNPQIFCLSANADDGVPSATPVTENFLIPQMLNEKMQGNNQSEIQITRSMLFNFSEKSDKSESESSREEPNDDGDNSSIWSIQTNASSTREEDDEEM